MTPPVDTIIQRNKSVISSGLSNDIISAARGRIAKVLIRTDSSAAVDGAVVVPFMAGDVSFMTQKFLKGKYI